ncbi:MAG: hypothetical protein WCP15_01800 [bacterium]
MQKIKGLDVVYLYAWWSVRESLPRWYKIESPLTGAFSEAEATNRYSFIRFTAKVNAIAKILTIILPRSILKMI